LRSLRLNIVAVDDHDYYYYYYCCYDDDDDDDDDESYLMQLGFHPVAVAGSLVQK
jgi:hypothetical protein